MASELESQWASMAASLGIIEDYFGYFETSWMSNVENALDDMLTETSPRPCSKEEALADREWSSGDSPVLLLSRAWRTARRSPQSFGTWKPSALSAFAR